MGVWDFRWFEHVFEWGVDPSPNGLVQPLRSCSSTLAPPRLLAWARKYRGYAMSEETTEFESWDEFNEFLKSASSSQLHELADKHNDCWVNLNFCREDQMLWDEGGDLGGLIYIRILGAPNISSQTLEFAIDMGSQSTWHRAYLNSTIMESPAITTELLLKIPVDDYLDDRDSARQMFFHPLASIDVIKHVIDDYPELIDRLSTEEDSGELVQKAQTRWLEISQTDRNPTSEEQEMLEIFLGIFSD
jgi:hypothetical protein